MKMMMCRCRASPISISSMCDFLDFSGLMWWCDRLLDFIFEDTPPMYHFSHYYRDASADDVPFISMTWFSIISFTRCRHFRLLSTFRFSSFISMPMSFTPSDDGQPCMWLMPAGRAADWWCLFRCAAAASQRLMPMITPTRRWWYAADVPITPMWWGREGPPMMMADAVPVMGQISPYRFHWLRRLQHDDESIAIFIIIFDADITPPMITPPAYAITSWWW